MRISLAPTLAFGFSLLIAFGTLLLLGMPGPLALIVMLAVGAVAAHQLGWREVTIGFTILAGILALIAAALFIFGPQPAFAQAVSSAASSVPTDTTVRVPVGSWLQGAAGVIADLLGLAIGALVTVILARVPAALRTYITAGMISQVDQLLGRAVQFGLQHLIDKEGSATLSVDVKSKVVADAVQYAIDHGPDKLIAAMGGASGIEQKIIARLPLPTSTAAPATAPTTTAAAAA